MCSFLIRLPSFEYDSTSYRSPRYSGSVQQTYQELGATLDTLKETFTPARAKAVFQEFFPETGRTLVTLSPPLADQRRHRMQAVSSAEDQVPDLPHSSMGVLGGDVSK